MQVSGNIVRSRHMYARKQGEEAYQRIVAALQPATRAALEEGFLETHWYPYEMLLDLCVTVDRVAGQGDLALCEEMGAFSCEHNLTRVYRIFFRFGNLNFLLDRAAKAWRSQYDFGSMVSERETKSRIHIVLSDAPSLHRAVYLAVKGWAFKAAELSGSEITKFEDGFNPEPGAPSRWTFEYL